jgi:hypothetical protein
MLSMSHLKIRSTFVCSFFKRSTKTISSGIWVCINAALNAHHKVHYQCQSTVTSDPCPVNSSRILTCSKKHLKTYHTPLKAVPNCNFTDIGAIMAAPNVEVHGVAPKIALLTHESELNALNELGGSRLEYHEVTS